MSISNSISDAKIHAMIQIFRNFYRGPVDPGGLSLQSFPQFQFHYIFEKKKDNPRPSPPEYGCTTNLEEIGRVR